MDKLKGNFEVCQVSDPNLLETFRRAGLNLGWIILVRESFMTNQRQVRIVFALRLIDHMHFHKNANKD